MSAEPGAVPRAASRAVVVGGAGFVGSHLTERLLAENWAVDVVDDLSSGSLANLAEARAMPGEMKFHTLDAGSDDFATLVALRPPAVIFHLGLLPPGRDAGSVAASSLRSMASVLEVARRHEGTKVVVAVSAPALYGDVPAKELPLKEGRAWSPVGVRGVVTRSVLDLLATYREQHAVEYTALALSEVYGPRQRADGGVVAGFGRALADGDTPVVPADGKQTRDFVFVDDAVDALVRAAVKGGGLLVHVGTGVATPLLDVWSMLAGPGATRPTTRPRTVDDVPRLSLSPTRARIHLAWAPWTDLATGLGSLDR